MVVLWDAWPCFCGCFLNWLFLCYDVLLSFFYVNTTTGHAASGTGAAENGASETAGLILKFLAFLAVPQRRWRWRRQWERRVLVGSGHGAGQPLKSSPGARASEKGKRGSEAKGTAAADEGATAEARFDAQGDEEDTTDLTYLLTDLLFS